MGFDIERIDRIRDALATAMPLPDDTPDVVVCVFRVVPELLDTIERLRVLTAEEAALLDRLGRQAALREVLVGLQQISVHGNDSGEVWTDVEELVLEMLKEG